MFDWKELLIYFVGDYVIGNLLEKNTKFYNTSPFIFPINILIIIINSNQIQENIY